MSIKSASPEISKTPIDVDSTATYWPTSHNLKPAYLSSLIIALLLGVASVAGILLPNDIYPSAELQQAFIANDVVNLFIGLPILLGSMWAARRGKLIGLLFWPGALFYGLYNYLVYLLAIPLTIMYPLYLGIVVLSLYTIIGLVASINGEAVKQRLNGRVPERLAGAVLAIFGILFLLLALGTMMSALINQSPISTPELALLVVDAIASPAWIIGGILLWRRQALGYVGGAGLLFQASMLFIGLIAVLILQPLLIDVPFSLTDVVVVLMMGLICFIPFALFIRGIIKL